MTPIFVFDGATLPSKMEVEEERRNRRERAYQLAMKMESEGREIEAINQWKQSIDITPFHASKVIEALKKRNVQCIVAPYEADAQMAYLSRSGYVDVVICEDSDMIPYGCSVVLFKMNVQTETCDVYKAEDLAKTAFGLNINLFQIQMTCIVSGCDYYGGVFGIGLKKAVKLIDGCTTIQQIVRKIKKLNLKLVEDDLETRLIEAYFTFNHQYIFDPEEQDIFPLTNFEDNEITPISYLFPKTKKWIVDHPDNQFGTAIRWTDEQLSEISKQRILGKKFEKNEMIQIANGKMNPDTLVLFSEERDRKLLKEIEQEEMSQLSQMEQMKKDFQYDQFDENSQQSDYSQLSEISQLSQMSQMNKYPKENAFLEKVKKNEHWNEKEKEKKCCLIDDLLRKVQLKKERSMREDDFYVDDNENNYEYYDYDENGNVFTYHTLEENNTENHLSNVSNLSNIEMNGENNNNESNQVGTKLTVLQEMKSLQSYNSNNSLKSTHSIQTIQNNQNIQINQINQIRNEIERIDSNKSKDSKGNSSTYEISEIKPIEEENGNEIQIQNDQNNQNEIEENPFSFDPKSLMDSNPFESEESFTFEQEELISRKRLSTDVFHSQYDNPIAKRKELASGDFYVNDDNEIEHDNDNESDHEKNENELIVRVNTLKKYQHETLSIENNDGNEELSHSENNHQSIRSQFLGSGKLSIQSHKSKHSHQ